jgi:hypothetical protein
LNILVGDFGWMQRSLHLSIEIFGGLARSNARFDPRIYIRVPLAGAPVVLKIRKHSSDFLHFFGTLILEQYIEFLSAPDDMLNVEVDN